MSSLSPRALAITAGFIWGACLLGVGGVHLLRPSYGVGFLDAMQSVYPGFHAARTMRDTLVGTGWGIVDGALGGFVFAWVYNLVAHVARRAA
jgi:hypothetical protein